MSEIDTILEHYENKVRNTLKVGSEFKVATLSHQRVAKTQIKDLLKREMPKSRELEFVDIMKQNEIAAYGYNQALRAIEEMIDRL